MCQLACRYGMICQDIEVGDPLLGRRRAGSRFDLIADLAALAVTLSFAGDGSTGRSPFRMGTRAD